jgi:uroporphyrinogen III methyltransferase / synthase
MTVSALRDTAGQLITDGWPADTPAALVERATMPWERRVAGTLSSIADDAKRAGISAPAVLVAGAAASFAADGNRPTILYTGLDPANFRALGDVIHWPALKVVRDEDGWAAAPPAIERLAAGGFEHVIFTSRVGVRSFFALLEENGLDARALAGTHIATAGTGTDLLLREYGVRADTVPEEVGSAGILSIAPDGGNVLLVQGTHAPTALEHELGRRGCDVARLALHRVTTNPELGRPLPPHDVIYFASPSGVRAMHDTYGAAAFERETWCMGDVTLAQLERLGFDGKVVTPYVSRNETATEPSDRRIAAARD